MKYDIPNPYAGMRIDVLYGYGRVRYQPNPHAISAALGTTGELEEGIPWLANEFRLQATELARADDDGMRQVSEEPKHV